MDFIVGKIKKIIYENETNGYIVALFSVSEISDEKDKEFKRKTITITGVIPEYKLEMKIKLFGKFIKHEKYGMQYIFNNYELCLPKENDEIISFLQSKFVKGCGKKLAENIVGLFGEKTIDVIKENKFALDRVEKMTPKRRDDIYNSIIEFGKSSDFFLLAKSKGFSIEEAGIIYSKYKGDSTDIINNNIYLFNDIIEFQRLDNLFLNSHSKDDERRIKACIVESIKQITYNTGNVYTNKEFILEILLKMFKISINNDKFNEYLEELEKELVIVVDGDKYYLQELYEGEIIVSELLKKINNKKIDNYDYDLMLSNLEKELGISYNIDQKNAIISSLNNNISIISGGPGTGKTTIINAIVKLYIKKNNLNALQITEQIALLAPTGRASKKMSLTTGISASTIHRYLKWNKETNEFSVNENNRNIQKLIIIDETSMIDLPLMLALLKGINSYVKLIFVGDAFQLPSVGPGNILNDLISSEMFNFIPLTYIYRQSEESYIPYFAKAIKNKDLTEEYLEKHGDYVFIKCDNESLLSNIKNIVNNALDKGLNEENIQILAPVYKGDYGIDNLNILLENLYNTRKNVNSITYNNVIYKEGDKVLQLVNDNDNNIYNGDIGYIKSIYKYDNKEFIEINFDGNLVSILKKDLKNIKHAYAITIHKSQGSEFDYVVMPIVNSYGRMLYNKLIYTGVSRAKKSLIVIGNPSAFNNGVYNDYSETRNTTLKEKIISIFTDNK